MATKLLQKQITTNIIQLKIIIATETGRMSTWGCWLSLEVRSSKLRWELLRFEILSFQFFLLTVWFASIYLQLSTETSLPQQAFAFDYFKQIVCQEHCICDFEWFGCVLVLGIRVRWQQNKRVITSNYQKAKSNIVLQISWLPNFIT